MTCFQPVNEVTLSEFYIQRITRTENLYSRPASYIINLLNFSIMAQYNDDSISSDGVVLQYITNVIPDSFDVEHTINLDKQRNVRPGLVQLFHKDDDIPLGYDKLCASFGVDSKKADYLLVYNYDIYFDEERDYRSFVSFPGGGNKYTVPGKPKLVAVAVANIPDNKVSKTAGEAL